MTLIDGLPLGDETPEVVYVDDDGDVGGEFITDEVGARYWLTAVQIDEYDEADASIVDDDKFNMWFRDFRHRNKITAVRERGRGRSWSDFWKRDDSKPKYLSEWSLSPVFRAAASTDETILLAEMLGGVSSIVRVLEPAGIRYRVTLTSDVPDAPRSYTSYEERLVSVSPQALFDKSLERGHAIDITSGFGLHEGSHVRSSEFVYDQIVNHPDGAPRPWTIGALLLNLLEDIRIERATAREFPGFGPYFEVANAYLWKRQEHLAPDKWGPQLKHKLNTVILAVKWPIEYEPIAKKAPRSQLAREFDWWRDWAERYLAGADARALVIEGLERLKESDKTAEQMAKMTESEEWREKAGESLKEAIESERKRFEPKTDLADPCPTPGRTDGVPGSSRDRTQVMGQHLKEEIERLVDESLMVDKPGIAAMDGDDVQPKVVILKPNRGYTAVSHPNRSLVNRMRNAFKFRPQDNDVVDRVQRSGRIDPTQLYRWRNDDWRVFSRKISKQKPNTSVTLLIDQSGSMGESKLRAAVEAAQVIHACLADMTGVTLRVRSHTADASDCGRGNIAIYRVWERNDPMDRLASVYQLPHVNNGDGYAIEWCARELIDSTRPSEQRLLIVLSDGQPSFTGYAVRNARQHVRNVVRWAESSGVTVVQISVDYALSNAMQAEMFTHFIPFEGLDALPGQVTKLLGRVL